MKHILKLLLLCLLFVSCEDVIEVAVPSTDPILIIDAHMNLFSDESPSYIEGGVRLSKSTDFFDTEKIIVSNAQVQLTNLSTGVSYPLPYSGSDGWYTTENLSIFSDIEATFELSVLYENQLFTGQSNIYAVSKIDSLKQGNRTLFEGDEIEIEITFSDNGSQDNYYLYELGFDQFQPIRDQFFQGSSFTFSHFYESKDVQIGDRLLIKGYGISKQYYQYMELLLQQAGGDGSPFGTVAATVRGNMVNQTQPDQFPLGYFIISEGVQEAIVIADAADIE